VTDILKASMNATLHLTKDGDTVHKLSYYSGEQDYLKKSAQRFVLETSMVTPVEVDLYGIGTDTSAAQLLVTTDSPVKVAVGNITYLWEISGAAMMVGAVSHVYVLNESTTNVANVEVVVSDDG